MLNLRTPHTCKVGVGHFLQTNCQKVHKAKYFLKQYYNYPSTVKIVVAVGSMAGVVGSNCQQPLPVRELTVKSKYELRGK